MTRRDMLRLMLAGAAGAVLDPEQLLWTPRAMVTVPAMPLVSPFNITTDYRHISLRQIAYAMGVPERLMLLGQNSPFDTPVAIAALPNNGEWFKLNIVHPDVEGDRLVWDSMHVRANGR